MSIYTTTTNGEAAYKGTGSHAVDLFFDIGASRNNIDNAIQKFDELCLADSDTAAAILLWARDIRHNGAGERKVFRTLIRELAVSDPEITEKVVKLIPAVGRFDDLRALFGTELESVALDVWAQALRANDAIAFKWVNIKKDNKLRKYMDFNNQRDFRKFIVAGRKDTTVEEKMCSNKWGTIEYGKLPSVASARYGKAFRKNDEARYQAFLDSNDTAINASAVFPYDVYRTLKYGNEAATATKQWANLPDLGVSGNILVMPDVSGSMMCQASGKIECLDISISMAVYLAQQIKGPFHNKFIAFSTNPFLIELPEVKNVGLKKVFNKVTDHVEYGSTNIQGAWQAILRDARKNKVSPEDMPSHILILSDMQFDVGSDFGYRGSSNGSLFGSDKTIKKVQTSYDKMKADFEAHGYEIPKIVYWNLNAHSGKPQMAHTDGVALVSGFSPSILKAVVAAETFTPNHIMEDAIAPFRAMLAAV